MASTTQPELQSVTVPPIMRSQFWGILCHFPNHLPGRKPKTEWVRTGESGWVRTGFSVWMVTGPPAGYRICRPIPGPRTAPETPVCLNGVLHSRNTKTKTGKSAWETNEFSGWMITRISCWMRTGFSKNLNHNFLFGIQWGFLVFRDSISASWKTGSPNPYTKCDHNFGISFVTFPNHVPAGNPKLSSFPLVGVCRIFWLVSDPRIASGHHEKWPSLPPYFPVFPVFSNNITCFLTAT